MDDEKLRDHLDHLDEYVEKAPEEFSHSKTEPGPTPQGRPGVSENVKWPRSDR